MLLAIRDYTKISTMDGPQTRTEKKGRDKKGGKGGLIYSAKHVRLTEALAAGAGSSTSGSARSGGVREGSAREPKAAKGPQRKR
jgi:hypothetical protein